MGERNDVPSWGGYTLSELESLKSNCSCSYTPNFNSNPDCQYETDKLGNVIGNNFPSAIEGLNTDFSKIVKRFDSEKSNSSTEIKPDPSLLNDLSSMVMKCECPTVAELIQDRDHLRLSWDEYFMNIAALTSFRSKDNNTKVGACLVDSHNRIIGCGYNGFIKGSNMNDFPNNRDGEWINSKYPYVVHAEANALLNTTVFDLTNSKMYCTLFPCNECAKLLIQKGISEIIYLSDKHHDDPPYIASRKLLSSANVITRPYEGDILL